MIKKKYRLQDFDQEIQTFLQLAVPLEWQWTPLVLALVNRVQGETQ
jgi:hypothetical protein